MDILKHDDLFEGEQLYTCIITEEELRELRNGLDCACNESMCLSNDLNEELSNRIGRELGD